LKNRKKNFLILLAGLILLIGLFSNCNSSFLNEPLISDQEQADGLVSQKAPAGVKLTQISAKYAGMYKGYHRVFVKIKNKGDTNTRRFTYNFTIDNSWILYNKGGSNFVQNKSIKAGRAVTFYTLTYYKPRFVEMNGYPYYIHCSKKARTVK
jgi:hypothetical protein